MSKSFGGVTAHHSRNGVVVKISPRTPTNKRRVSSSIRVLGDVSVADLLEKASKLARSGYTVDITGYAPDAPNDPGRLKIGVAGMSDQELAYLLEQVAMQPIEQLNSDRIPDYIATAEDVVARLRARWSDLYPGGS